MNLQYFGHSFFKISFGKTNVLIDPYISHDSGPKNFERLVKCPVKETDIKKVDAIFISNESFDHCDKKILDYFVKRDSCAVISHESILSDINVPQHLKKAVGVNERFSFRDISFEILPAHCPSYFYPLGLVLRKDGESIFFAGDTTLTDYSSFVKANIAAFPIGGSITMDVIDAVKATKSMKPDYVIPMHYNTFDLIKADPNDFKARIEKSILKTEAVILKAGQSFKY